LGDDDKFAQSLESEYGGFERSLPNIKDLQSNKDTLISEGTSKANAALDRCYKKGWLQAELLANKERLYIFPSKLHERYAKILLSSTLPEFPQRQFP
jgi:hypothetical protein